MWTKLSVFGWVVAFAKVVVGYDFRKTVYHNPTLTTNVCRYKYEITVEPFIVINPRRILRRYLSLYHRNIRRYRKSTVPIA
jgi:hypothetical protein